MRVDPAVQSLKIVEMLHESRFADVCAMFPEEPGGSPPTEYLGRLWAEAVDHNGPISTIGTPSTEPAGMGRTLVKVPVLCKGGGFGVLLSLDEGGLLQGLRLGTLEEAAPLGPWTPPDYCDPTTFTESDVLVGDGQLAVPGTLSLPKTGNRVPAVVQLPGSGQMDRDSSLTHSRNKPLKDVAWGIASRKIAVLRFDKVTYAHPDKIDFNDFTLAVEYMDHAVSAIRMLRRHPSIDPARIFLLGHSAGGTVAPRIAQIDTELAGLIVLAGATVPLHRALVRQYRYFASLQPGGDVDADPAVQEATRQAALIDSPEFSATAPAGEVPPGAPAAYWLQLRDLDPVATAARLDKPMLILQGGRDYQVTVDDDLIRWRNGLGDRDDVTIRVYDSDNHQFFSGSGPSTPMEYIPTQHVDPAVIADIAHWVLAH